MKDQHDNKTGELLSLPAQRVPPSAEADGCPAGAVPHQDDKPLGARDLRLLKLEMDRGYRAREGLTTFLPVAMVAKEWRVTSRRVRALLSAGRLAGRQHENGYWEVAYPYTLTEGRRGPSMRRNAPKKPELRVV